ncbi:MAG: archaemetzincin family Zn-dependent metalloprotease [Candidatus Bathyarchaeia archaeon]
MKTSTILILQACYIQDSQTKDLALHITKTFPNVQCQLKKIDPEVFSSALDKERAQYLGDRVLEILNNLVSNKNEGALLLVDFDLFAPGLNFIFGQASSRGKIAVVSVKRLKSGEANSDLFSSRLRKEAVHELGHTMGFEHCADASCVMYFSNFLEDTDFKKDIFCSDCSHRV